MARSITAAALILLLPACSGSSSPLTGRKNSLNYAQYHSLEAGLRAKSILRAFGKPYDLLEKNGKVRGLTYWCEDANGDVVELRMVFNEAERLQHWVLKGETSYTEPPPKETPPPTEDPKPPAEGG
ncbi:MAG: hypothetical protein ACYTGV_02035 [Planctomycetota bacterium]